ncbi:MAG: TraR/DksA C4-type zinc finger protein [Natronincolaceae bacterium]|nr:TraR/DksA C4-type zinc finger protein [Bacillota bacterium]
MDKEKIEYFKKKLLKEKEDALNVLKIMEERHPTDQSLKEYIQELSFYDNHPADIATELTTATMQANLENHQRYRITEIDRALEKIEDGTYGSCQICGADVLEERLELMPEANICINCARDKLDAYKSDTDRPAEEDVIYPSYRKEYEDYDGYTGFDGEDAYQAVARFNEVKDDPSHATGDHLGIFDDYDIGTVEEVESVSEGDYESRTTYTGEGMMNSRKQEDKEDEEDEEGVEAEY